MAWEREQVRVLVEKVLLDLERRGLVTEGELVPARSATASPVAHARAVGPTGGMPVTAGPETPAPMPTAPMLTAPVPTAPMPTAPMPTARAAMRPVAPPPAAASAQPRPASVASRPDADRRVAIGSDHGGFALKKTLIELLRELRYEVQDCGTYSKESCDYPDFAIKVGEAVRSGGCGLGIMIDGAGIGSAMALNKMPGIRAATVHNEATAANSREHNDANVLVLGSGQMHPGHARRITRIWLQTPHAGGRHARRVAKINALDEGRA